MDTAGMVTKPLDPCKQLEDACKKALEDEDRAITEAKAFVARSVEPGEENPVINSEGKWVQAAQTTSFGSFHGSSSSNMYSLVRSVTTSS